MHPEGDSRPTRDATLTASTSPVRRLSTPALAAVVAMLAIAFAVYPFAIRAVRIAGHDDQLPSAMWYALSLLAVTFSATAVVIHRRQPHLVGWLMHAVGVLLAAAQLGTAVYLLSGLGREFGMAGRLLAAWTGFEWAPALIVMTVLLPLLFPSGRPPGPRWWWVAGGGVAGLGTGSWRLPSTPSPWVSTRSWRTGRRGSCPR